MMDAMISTRLESGQARLASPFGGRQLITRKVAAAILGVDIKTLAEMRAQRLLPGVETERGEVRFSESDLRAYLAASTRSAAA